MSSWQFKTAGMMFFFAFLQGMSLKNLTFATQICAKENETIKNYQKYYEPRECFS